MRIKNKRDLAGLYIHVPFCKRRCIYCDFYSVGNFAGYTQFIDSVEKEYKTRKEELAGFQNLTLYIGGGTPSILPANAIQRIRNWAELPVVEFTIEVNPDDVTPDKADMWLDAGIDRVSMGVQSLDDGELKAIGRRHDSLTAIQAYDILKDRFENISLDLMFGLPGQTFVSLRNTVEEFIRLRPCHISAYSLMYEESTGLTRMRDVGKIIETPENYSVRMFEMINYLLVNAGYERYEISNYALPGYRSRHNSNYWKGMPYLGLGPSAHSYDGNRIRRMNPGDLKSYLAYYNDEVHSLPFYEEEILSDEELREEMIMTRLRTSEGLDLKEYEKIFGVSERIRLKGKAQRFLISGDLNIKAYHLRLSDSGVMISDEIISSLF